MRNLKKILALALALVMSMSLMATANAFTDDDSITDTYETAVTVLSGLQVFQGYDDGTFQPQGAITRAEVAAIIYRIVTGDVADTQVGIYADYNKFDDVASTSWYAGYVNFCANAEYIKGYDARTFGPNDPVTGYQALAMILRALGYDKNGEFTGTNWQVQTAAVGESRGITKNITAGTLGVPATREVVAEILFQAILVNTVNYTPAFGYRESDTSLGYETFGLEGITGVVVANEYADLYDTNTLRAGRTELDVDGDSYMIELATTLEDIGEAQHAYVAGSTVLAIADAGNTVFETGAATDIGSDSDFEDATGMEKAASIEYFLNFDGGDIYSAADRRISYVLQFTASSDDNFDAMMRAEGLALDHNDFEVVYGAVANTYTREEVFRAGEEIPSADLGAIEYIFDEGDLVDDVYIRGEVYVGTQSNDDISDTLSYEEFVDEYLELDEDAVEVNGNENGNWLKVVDNDGDGEADVVMKTIYTFAGMEDIDRDDALELTSALSAYAIGNSHSPDAINAVDEDTTIACADELNEGDVVYYALIDGKAQTYLAEMVTAEIDSVNRRTDTATTTDGDEYTESDTCGEHIWDEFEEEVIEMAGSTSYDMYLDKYGYLGVFTETATSGNFVLLTDGWYNETKTAEEFAVEAYIDGEIQIVDVDENAELFIDSNSVITQNNSWDNLFWFDGINDGGRVMKTIVASLDENGDLSPVDGVFNKRDVNVIAVDEDEILGRDYTTGVPYYTARNDTVAYDTQGINDLIKPNTVEIRALSTTVYYYVYQDGRDTVVNEYVGYNNLPTLDAASEAMIEDVYAVGTRTSREYDHSEGTTRYYTADVVVVEFDGRYLADAEQVFIVDTPVVGTNVTTDEVEVIRADGTSEVVRIDLENSRYNSITDYSPTLPVEYGIAGSRTLMPGLYYLWETETEGLYTVTAMDHYDIGDNNYATGKISTADSTMSVDWAEVHVFNWVDNNDASLYVGDTNVYPELTVTEDSLFYRLSYDEDDDYNATLDPSDADDVLSELGDRNAVTGDWDDNTVMVAYNGSNEIIYAISFANFDGENVAGTDMVINFAQHVWNNVKPDEAEIGAPEVTFYGQDIDPVNGEFVDSVDYSVAKANEDLDPSAIDVENCSIVIGDKTTALTTDENVYTGTILGEDGEYYTFSLTQSAAGTSAKLLQVTDGDEVDEFTIPDDWSIQEFIAQFYLEDENATIKWEFTTEGGTYFTFNGMTATGVPGNVTTTEVASVVATVTPENGDTTANKVYMDSDSQTTADQVDYYKTAFKAAINNTTFPGLDDYDEDPGVIAAKEALEKAIDDCKTMDELYAIRNNATFNDSNTYVKALNDAIDAAEAAAEEASKEAAQKEIEAAAEALILPELRVTASSSATSDVISAVKTEVESEISNAVYHRSATVEVNSWSAPTSGATAEAVCDITITLRSKTDSSVVTTRLFENVTVYVTVS